MTAYVASLTSKTPELEQKPADRFSRQSVQSVTLVAGQGILGDTKSRPDSRQLNVMFSDSIKQLRCDGFRVAPGELGEQIVIDGISAEIPTPGARLHLGQTAVIELVYFRVPCRRFARIQNQPKDAARGRLGFMARVLVGGEVAIGSPAWVDANRLSTSSSDTIRTPTS